MTPKPQEKTAKSNSPSKADELVLVIPRPVLDDAMYFHGVTLGTLILSRIIQLGSSMFLTRGVCEENPDFKQIVTYVLIRHVDLDGPGDTVFMAYTRGSESERRLDGSLSIGVGGHINPDDMDATLPNFKGVRGFCAREILNAAKREILEELGISENPNNPMNFVGLINDDFSKVGAVHLGVLMVMDVTTEQRKALELGEFEGHLKTNVEGFFTLNELCKRHSQLEDWSRMLLPALLKGPVQAFH